MVIVTDVCPLHTVQKGVTMQRLKLAHETEMPRRPQATALGQ